MQGLDGKWVEIEAEDFLEPAIAEGQGFQNWAFDAEWFDKHNHAQHLGPVLNCAMPNDSGTSGTFTISSQAEVTRKFADQNVGWECPKCGACFAPHVTRCENCVGNVFSPVYPQPYEYTPAVPMYPYGNGTYIISSDNLSGTVLGNRTDTAVELDQHPHCITSDTVVVQDNPYERDGVYFTQQAEHLSGSAG